MKKYLIVTKKPESKTSFLIEAPDEYNPQDYYHCFEIQLPFVIDHKIRLKNTVTSADDVTKLLEEILKSE